MAYAEVALEAVTDALHQDVAEHGISVLAVEPGAFRKNVCAGVVDVNGVQPAICIAVPVR